MVLSYIIECMHSSSLKPEKYCSICKYHVLYSIQFPYKRNVWTFSKVKVNDNWTTMHGGLKMGENSAMYVVEIMICIYLIQIPYINEIYIYLPIFKVRLTCYHDNWTTTYAPCICYAIVLVI